MHCHYMVGMFKYVEIIYVVSHLIGMRDNKENRKESYFAT